MLQPVARLKLFAEGFLITDVPNVLGFDAFQEVQFTIEFDTEGVASGTLFIQLFDSFENLLDV